MIWVVIVVISIVVTCIVVNVEELSHWALDRRTALKVDPTMWLSESVEAPIVTVVKLVT